jgi:hypothetical protein
VNYVPRRTLPVISVSPVHISASPLLAHVDVTNREAATAWGHDCPNAHGPSSPILDRARDAGTVPVALGGRCMRPAQLP